MYSSSMGFGCGSGKKSLTSMESSGSNHGRCFHRVHKRLVLVAVVMLTLPNMANKISLVSMLILSSSA
uniref:Uncharacterized protein n=1 Tax=Arundo donax TaxID=35708 RepID=A0A0A8ZJB3_ARUDO